MWGTGVTSLMLVTRRPVAWRERIAASRPEPGPFTNTSTVRRPWSIALRAAASPARCAAKAVPLREPRNPTVPELAHERTSPFGSVRVTIVLLNVADMKARPCGTNFRSRRRVRARLGILYVDPPPGGELQTFAINYLKALQESATVGRSGSYLVGDFLLVSNCTTATALRSCVGLCALSACGEATTVAKATVASDVD